MRKKCVAEEADDIYRPNGAPSIMLRSVLFEVSRATQNLRPDRRRLFRFAATSTPLRRKSKTLAIKYANDADQLERKIIIDLVNARKVVITRRQCRCAPSKLDTRTGPARLIDKSPLWFMNAATWRFYGSRAPSDCREFSFNCGCASHLFTVYDCLRDFRMVISVEKIKRISFGNFFPFRLFLFFFEAKLFMVANKATCAIILFELEFSLRSNRRDYFAISFRSLYEICPRRLSKVFYCVFCYFRFCVRK